jgi:hypothetical protein
MKRETLETLPIGTRVFQSIMGAAGTIVRHDKSAQFGNLVVVVWDAESMRPDTRISPVHFEPGIGRRFWRLDDWRAERARQIAEMHTRFAEMGIK